MKDIFEKALAELMAIEGIYSNSAYDRGGETKFGITKKTARAHGYLEEMVDLPFWKAKQIYRADYWDKLNLNKIAQYSPNIAKEIFEAGVNCGIARSAKWLQEAINLIGTPYLVVDGIIGVRTLRILNEHSDSYSREVISKIINALQANHYINICNKDETQKVFIRGWFRRVKF